MTFVSRDEPPDGDASRIMSLADSDRALLLAMTAWGGRCGRQDDGRANAEVARDFFAIAGARLAPGKFGPIHDVMRRDGPASEVIDPAVALDRLTRMHHASARVDLARVHFTWLERALREESPAVQRAIAASLPESLRYPVQGGLLLDSQDLVSDRAPAPEVARWARALWTERLVGGERERADDSPAIIMLSRLSPRTGYRLCRLTGLCKLILARYHLGNHGRATEQARLDWLDRRLSAADQGQRAVAKHDIQASRSAKIPSRQLAARAGLATVARLLTAAEPFRLRWALQHWPYPVAKLIRSLMPPAPERPPALLDGESMILKTAWDRLNLEGRLALAWPLAHSPEPNEPVWPRAEPEVSESEMSLFKRPPQK